MLEFVINMTANIVDEGEMLDAMDPALILFPFMF